MGSQWLKDLSTLAILVAVYVVAGKLGLQLAFVNASATAVWAPAGIALAAFLTLGYRVWPAILTGAFLVNLARGAVCDENALLDALRTKRIAGAGLDVFRTEPLPPDSPFWDLDNVMISAHCSGSSDDNLELTWPIIETNMARFLEGRTAEMINVVPH